MRSSYLDRLWIAISINDVASTGTAHIRLAVQLEQALDPAGARHGVIIRNRNDSAGGYLYTSRKSFDLAPTRDRYLDDSNWKFALEHLRGLIIVDAANYYDFSRPTSLRRKSR
jgi:hypothetical protein